MGLSANTGAARDRKRGEVELDLGRYELRRGGRRVKLERKPMELLIFLVGRREQLVSRQDVVARLWPADPLIDTERNINNLVRKIRRALGDEAAKPRFLETVVGKGYRFIGPVRVIAPAYPPEAPRLPTREDARRAERAAPGAPARPRYSRDPLAYAEFMQGYQRSSSGDPKLLIEAIQHLTQAVTRDPEFALAHATLAVVSATRHFEFDPSRAWLDKAEFHCQRALELDGELPEAHVAKAFLLWGPAKNFQHVEAIAELKRALALEKNLPHAYNRLGTILAHVGLLEHARTMYERGMPFQPRKKVNPSIAQVYMWNGEYERAREEVERWRADNPENKYAIYFAPQPAMMCGDWEQAAELLDQAVSHMPQEPLIISLEGVLNALTGKPAQALQCVSQACENPKTFGHAHHTYYQIACINSLLGYSDLGFQWLERSVDTGFACWPFFMRDPCLKNLRSDARFELLVSSLQAKYPDQLGLL